MGPEEFKAAIDFDKNLQIGQIVEVRWTNSHRYFRAKAEIVKLNEKSLKAKLLEAVGTGMMSYPMGQVISTPRIADFKGWTWNNSTHPYSPAPAAP